MVEVLIIVYSMLMFIVFKVFKVPLNKWTGTTAVLGGVVSIGFLLLMMGMYHPFTKEARIYTLTTPVLPTVTGRITEVNVRTGDRVQAGESLFQIDPEPFQYQVDRLEAGCHNQAGYTARHELGELPVLFHGLMPRSTL